MPLPRVQAILNRREIYLVTVVILFGFALFQLDLATTSLPVIAPESASDGTAHLDVARNRVLKGPASPPPLADVQDRVGAGKLTWGKDPPPMTKLLEHTPGWTIFDNVYMLNGTIYLVTDKPETMPEKRMMISTGYPVYNGEEEINRREPTDAELQVISPQRARQLFGDSAHRIDGASFLITEPNQFVHHYYHFSAELLFGLWRAYSSLDPEVGHTGISTLPPPRRFMFPHLKTDEWRDYAQMNHYVLHASFPSISLEFEQDWKDRAGTLRPWIFDKVLLADRSASVRGRDFIATQRFAASSFNLPGGARWWQPIRDAVVEFAGVDRSAGANPSEKPVITYVSRQDWGRRMLKPEDHEGLVRALKKLEAENGYEIHIVSMDKLTRDEQIRLAARTTIMMGVHGNGLTSLVWMNPRLQSTVIEFFYPGGFAFDYEWTTRALGMTHFGFWGSSHFTSPDLPPAAYPEGFQGNDIPLDGQAVADLIVQRLSLNEELDD